MKLFERVTATQRTIDDHLHKPFIWGELDCAILATNHLANLGYTTRLKEAGNYRTELGAIRALKRLGYNDLADIGDAMGFERIAPAAALVGDIVGLRGGTEAREWTAIGVCVGNGRVIAFADAGNGPRCEWGPIEACKIAWRVT